MRLAILALSAAAISGCSWYGGAGHPGAPAHCATAGQGYQQAGHHYGYGPGARCVSGQYGVAQTATTWGHHPGHAAQGYASQGYASQGYAAQGYPAQGYAAQGYAMPAQTAGLAAQGHAAQTTVTANGYPAPATTLSAHAPYGTAVSGAYGQPGAVVAQGHTSGVQTVMGAPIYVPQPYPAPYPAPYPSAQPRGSACCNTVQNVAMPFGLEVFAGTEFDVSGDIFTKKSDGPPDGDFSIGLRVGEIDPISYSDAFGGLKKIGGAFAKDLSHQTTVYGALSHGTAKGQTVEGYTTVEPGSWTGTTFTSSGAARALDGTFSDLKLTTLEGGVRHYVGYNPSLRPYIGASAGMSHNNEVTFQQTYSDDGTYYGQRQFVDDGWSPTASATVGAEMAIGPRTAIGVESGVRWRDNMDTAAPSEDRITVPLTLRGRLAF